MSQISKAFFGALAIFVACGAVQFAFGHDLIGSRQALTNAPATGVNRAAKADRVAPPSLAQQSRTIALRFDGLADTSVVIRVPLAKEANKETNKQAKDEARDRPAAPATMKTRDRKATVACEPVVSVLTDVAKLLQPGRCVT